MPNFLTSLRQALDNATQDSPICWQLHVVAGIPQWCVRVKRPFEPCDVLMNTNSQQFRSFMRQMSHYQFAALPGWQYLWFHPAFRKDIVEMQDLMSRKRKKAPSAQK